MFRILSKNNATFALIQSVITLITIEMLQSIFPTPISIEIQTMITAQQAEAHIDIQAKNKLVTLVICFVHTEHTFVCAADI